MTSGVNVTYDNTFDSDVGQTTVALTAGGELPGALTPVYPTTAGLPARPAGAWPVEHQLQYAAAQHGEGAWSLEVQRALAGPGSRCAQDIFSRHRDGQA